MKNAFDISFADEDAESVFRNICEKSREKVKKKNKKKSKIDKKSTKAVNLSEWEHIFIYLFIYLTLKWLSNHADLLLNLHDEKSLSV